MIPSLGAPGRSTARASRCEPALRDRAPDPPAVEAQPAVNKGKPEKSRKRSDKKGPKKPSKPRTRPAQDEWGLLISTAADLRPLSRN